MTKMKLFQFVGIFLLVFVIFGVSEVMAHDYEPLPGVLGPDEVDLGGRTVTIVTRGDLEAQFAPGQLRESRLQRAEDLFNINIEQVDLGRDRDGEGLLTRIMAGDSNMDIIRINTHSGYLQTLGQGGFYPVGDLLPPEYFDALNLLDQTAVTRITDYKGHLHGLGGGYLDGEILSDAYFITANVDLLEREGMPDVYELYKAGEWTYEAFEDIMSQVTRDTTGDGEIDQFGVSQIDSAHRAEQFVFSNNAAPIQQIDGNWVFTYHRPEATTVLDKIYEWQEYMVDQRTWNSDEAEEGKLAFVFHHHRSGLSRAADGVIDFDIQIVPLPMGPDATGYSTNTSWVSPGGLLATNAERPEELIAIHNYLWRTTDKWDENEYLATFQPTRESYAVIQEINALWEGQSALFRYMTPPGVDEAVMEVFSGERSARAAMEAVQPEAQAFLDDFFGQ